MVLHLGGCGRVGHRHNNLQWWGPEHNRSRPHHFSIPTRQAARGASLETRKTISGRPPFLAYAPFIATSTCQHMLPCERTPRIRTQRRDYRKRARLACNCAASTQAPLTRPMRPPAHSALLCSSLALDAFLSGILSGLLCHARSAWLLGVRGVY